MSPRVGGSPTVVRIGCLSATTGPEASHGIALARSVGLAVKEAFVKSDLPFHLELVAADETADPAGAAWSAETLARDPRVIGVVGPMTSDAALAAAPVFNRVGLPHLTPSATNPTLTRSGYRYTFRVVADDSVQGSAAGRFAVTVLRARRAAVIHDGSGFGQPLAEYFRRRVEELGVEVCEYSRIERGRSHYGEAVAAIKRASPDVVFFGTIEAEGALIARQLREAGVTAVFCGTDPLKPSRFLVTADYPADGPYQTSVCTDVAREPWAAGFEELYRREFGEIYSVYTAEAFDCARIIIDAVLRLFRKGAALTREAVRDEIAATRGFPGASGRITFDETGGVKDPRVRMYGWRANAMTFLGFVDELVGGKL